MTAVSIAVLGHVEVRRPGEVIALARASQLLLGCLALFGSEAPVRRERLAELMWPDMDAHSQKARLRTALWRLKKGACGALDDVLELQCDTVMLHPCATLTHSLFEKQAISLCAVPLEDMTDAGYSRLEHIMTYYTGPLMEGFDAGWILPLRETFADLYCSVLERQIKYLRAHGRDHESIRSSRELLALDPYREDVHAALIALYGKAGRPARAVQQYRACESLMARDLGVQTKQARKSLERVLNTGQASADLPGILKALEVGVQDLSRQIMQLRSALKAPQMVRDPQETVPDKVS